MPTPVLEAPAKVEEARSDEGGQSEETGSTPAWSPLLGAIAAADPLARPVTLGTGNATKSDVLLQLQRTAGNTATCHWIARALAADHALVLSHSGGPPPSPSALPVNHLPIGGTSLGLLVSAGVVDSEHGPAVHYTFSHRTGGLSRPEVERIAALLLRLRHDEGLCRLVAGDHGVTHLIVAPDGR